VKFRELCLVAALGAIAGCGGANAGPSDPGGSGGSSGAGGTAGSPLVGQSTFRLSCENGTLQLSIPIELVVELTEPYSNSRSTEATFSASVTLDEESVASLIDAAGNPLITIVSALVTANVAGATPTMMTASLGGVPFSLDLQDDPDNNGMPGPHRFELAPMTATANADPGAREVVFRLRTDGVSLVLGTFNIPMNCFSPSLFGPALEFPVSP